MKVILAGGSGQIGMILARSLASAAHEVVILSRGASRSPFQVVRWDAETLGPWADELNGADVIINLAGRSVNCRYGAVNRRAITESRVKSTTVVGQAIAQAARPPRVWLQSSTATIYAHRNDAPNDEANGVMGGAEPGVPDTWRFSVEVARAWEQAAHDAKVPRTRKVLLRSAMTMSPDRGGVFDVLLRLVRWGLGGTNGDGRQYVSWIHEADFVRAVDWLIDHELDGPVNLASPQPLPNEAFMRALRRAWGTRLGLPAARWMLEVGALALRTETELVLKSRRVVPGRLLEQGFTFRFPEWPAAAADLCRRWRQANSNETRSAEPGGVPGRRGGSPLAE